MMCRRVQCNTCKRPSFAGCGAHIEQVLGDVPKADRCRCREQVAGNAQRAEQPPASSPGWLRGLFGK